MTPTLATVARDLLTLSEPDQEKVLDILRIVRGEPKPIPTKPPAITFNAPSSADVSKAIDAIADHFSEVDVDRPIQFSVTALGTAAEKLRGTTNGTVETDSPKGRKRVERYGASDQMIGLLSSLDRNYWTTRTQAAKSMGKPKASVYRAETTALKRGLIEAMTKNGVRYLRLPGTPE